MIGDSKMHLIKILISLITILGLTGCSSTVINSSWKSPDYTDKISAPYIIAILKNETERRLYEDKFRTELMKSGVMAIQSYKDLTASNETDEKMIADRIAANSADSTLIVRFVSQRTEEIVEPARVTTYVSSPRFARSLTSKRGYVPAEHYYDYGNYYTRSYQTIYEPAKVTDYHVNLLEANLYDAASHQMIWSAQFEVYEDSPKQDMLDDFIHTVIEDLKAKELI